MDIQFQFSQVWATAYFLVKRKGYELLQIQRNEQTGESDEEKSIIHLIKKVGKEYRYIRLAPADFVWSSVVERDVKESANLTETFRKRFRIDKLEALNLYFFPTEPIPDVKKRIEDFSRVRIGNRTFLQSAWIDLENPARIDSIGNLTSFYLSKEELTDVLQDEKISAQYYRDEVVEMQRRRANEVKNFFLRATPLWTYILIGINVFLFFLLTINGGSTNTETLIKFGAKVNNLIVEGEWWRLFTAMFLHIGFVHLAFNSIALYYLGHAVERMYGSGRFIFIYIVSGLLGSIASFLFTSNISAGASGAIYGCFGALLYFGYRRKELFFQGFGRDIIAILVLNLAISVMVPTIDLFGHLGGLVGGFLAAGVIGLPQLRSQLVKQCFFAVVLILLFIGAYSNGIDKWSNSINYQIQKIEDLIFVDQDYVQAEKQLQGIIAKGKTKHDEWVYYYLGLTQLLQDHGTEGKENLEKAYQLDPKFVQPLMQLANYAYYIGDYDASRQYIEQILAIEPQNELAQKLLKSIEEGES